MRTGLLVLGVIFLVLGGVLYFIPELTAGATTAVVDAEGADTRTAYASVLVSWPIILATLLIGLVLFLLGLALPGDTRRDERHRTDEEGSHTVQTRERIVDDDGRRVTRERREHH